MSRTTYYVYKNDVFINRETYIFWLFKNQDKDMFVWQGPNLGWKKESEVWCLNYKKGFMKISKATACLIMLTGMWKDRKVFKWD